MRICFYSDSISEHQMPVAFEIVRIYGEDNVRYFYKNDRAEHRKKMMGADAVKQSWTLKISENYEAFQEWTENSDVLYTIFRLPDLFERRIARNLKSLYMSERWLKPPTGALRLLHPGYFRMARRMSRCFESGLVTYLPTGVVAAADMMRVVSLVNGDFRGLLTRQFVVERKVGSIVEGCSWMRLWGYFVASSGVLHSRHSNHKPLRVLWVGRYLKLKRVDTIVKAVASLSGVELDLFGAGEAENIIKKLASGCDRIHFHPSIPLQEVREQMRNHDVYVMSSNGFDGWGAVVSEAIEEGMLVLGTDCVGAPATILPCENLFKVGDWASLAQKLQMIRDDVKTNSAPRFVSSVGWRSSDAVQAFCEMCK